MAHYYFSGTTGDDWTATTVETPAGENDQTIVNTNWGSGPGDAASRAVPTSADDVELQTGGPIASVVIGAPEYAHTDQAVDVNSLTIDSGMVLADNTSAVRIRSALTNEGGFSINSGELNFGQAVVENGQVVGGTIQNDAVMSLAAGAYLGITGNVTLQGTGTVTMAGGGNNGFGAYITGAPDADPDNPNIGVLTNDSTIEGGGQIAAQGNFQYDPANTLVVNNYGLIDATDTTYGLTVHLNNGPGGGLTNGGLVEATGGATLNVIGTLITQTMNGQLGAYGAGSLVTLNGVDIVGGSITGSDGGIVEAAVPPGIGSYGANMLDGSADHPVTIQAGGTFQVGNGEGGGVTVKGSLVNHGTFELFSGGHNAELAIDAAGATFSGGGKVILVDNGDYPSQIAGFSTTTATTLHNVDNVFSGAGLIGTGGDSSAPSSNLLDFDNEAGGIVDADQSYGALTLNTPITNAGLIEDTGAAGLVLSGNVIEQSGGGTIKADGSNAIVYLQGTTIEGGTLASANGGGFAFSAPNSSFFTSTLDGSTAAGAVTTSADIDDTETLALKGAIHNSGTITVEGGSVVQIADPDVTLDGGGQIVLTRAYYTSGLNGFDASTTATLHNVDNTISGAGASIGGDYGNGGHGLSLTIDNQTKGVIDADGTATDGSEALDIEAAVTNAGLIEDTGAAGLVLSGNVIEQSGGGTIKADGSGAIVYLQGTTIEGGTLASANGGSFAFSVPNSSFFTSTLDGSTAAGAVTISAEIDVTAGLALKGTIHNTGTIIHGMQIADQDVTLDGGGKVLLQQASYYYYDGIDGYDPNIVATLHNLDNTISGAGEIGVASGNDNLLDIDNQAHGVIEATGDATDGSDYLQIDVQALHNAGLIEDTGAAGMTIAAATLGQAAGGIIEVRGAGRHISISGATGAFGNAGLLEAKGGTLTIDDAVTGSGRVVIAGGGTVAFGAAVGRGQAVSFQGLGGTLQLDDAAAFHGTISGFQVGDAVAGVLADATLSYAGTASGGVLTLSDSSGDTETLRFAGRYAASEFAVDANGDLALTHTVNYSHAAGAVGVDLVHQEADVAAAGAAVPHTAKAIDHAATDFFAGVTSATGSAHDDVLLGSSAANALSGGAGDDTLSGGGGDDHLAGGSGDDVLNGGAGADSMAGGTGNDTYVVNDANDTVTEVAGKAGGTDLVKSSVSFTLGAHVENLTLTGRAAIDGTGNTLANHITGNAGANHLAGGGGNDVLDGGAGSDTLTGGGGHDTFVFDSRVIAANADHITDFAHQPDTIELAKADFGALAAGHLAATDFVANADGQATMADQHIIYDTTTGALLYDVDGNGSHAAVQFATIDNHAHAVVTAADFLVV
ncbi:MAG TPA: hypothetical protein VHD15_12410 [Hyphomicrobiales bacterium]|nr:hypothetical protein [Hyphomicrobiales bacterium]